MPVASGIGSQLALRVCVFRLWIPRLRLRDPGCELRELVHGGSDLKISRQPHSPAASYNA
jgi:hypothetical protein